MPLWVGLVHQPFLPAPLARFRSPVPARKSIAIDGQTVPICRLPAMPDDAIFLFVANTHSCRNLLLKIIEACARARDNLLYVWPAWIPCVALS